MNFIVPSYLYVSATQATVLRILYTTWKDLVARGIKISQTCVMVQWIYDMRITYNVLIYDVWRMLGETQEDTGSQLHVAIALDTGNENSGGLNS